ncbi:MAG: DNA polymerase III subunit gamma/tau [Flavobacteriales bacterium]|nr:DNA polymerase III subunit gamma/tau [Flavobacteriales bacterium]
MSEFLVSARKYRPQTFDQVVGQSSVTSTLQNAIKSNQLAQSFLFCGPRGIGKTTCARIFAKEINIFNSTESIDDFSFNIFELDAASNNSVDDIRNLVEQVRVPPQIGKYKVYIIDEVHMLSQAAFNAFLKTLEEPPVHAKFILATTEKHKIIPTILSRCQIFDFKRVNNDDIVKNLKYVAEQESITVDDDALFLIAEKSDGALRDSLSLFDRLVSFSEKKLTYQDVANHLNILDYQYYFNVTEHLISNDISSLFIIFNEIIDNGFDGQHFINGLSEHLRTLLLCQNKQTVSLFSVNESLKEKYLQQAELMNINFLVNALKLANTCDLQYKASNNKRLLVEICLMQISSFGFDVEPKKKNKKFVVSKTFNRCDFNEKKESLPAESITKKEEDLKVEISEEKVSSSIDQAKLPKNDTSSSSLKSKTISILSSLNDVDEETESKKGMLPINSDDFSFDLLMKKWKEMISHFKNLEKSNLALNLNINKPELIESNKIKIILSNSSQVELIEQEKINILTYLRNSLNNDLLELETQVKEIDKNDVPYTNSDKYKKMFEENENLAKLGARLGLDPDY